MYWSPELTLSYNAIYNMIIGNRGGGKSVGALKYAIERSLKSRRESKGNDIDQFVYVRRYKEELKRVTQMQGGKLFDDIKKLGFFPSVELKAESNILYADGDIIGYALALTDADMYKSIPMPNVKLGILEEFILKKGYRHYLPGEVETFLDLDQTIDRDRDQLRWLLIGNHVSDNNPYMTYWDCDVPWRSQRKLYGNDNQILVEMVQDPEFIEKKKQTRRGKLIAGTRYGDHAIENKTLMDNPEFVAKKPGSAEYRMTLIYFDKLIGVWLDVKNGKFYISPDVDRQYPIIFAATTEDQAPNVMLLKGAKKSPMIKRLLDAYYLGCVYYENKKVKSWFRDIIRMSM